MSILVLDAVTAGYGATDVLQALSLEVAADEIVAVLGPNGSGKSTLLKAAMGLAQVHAGTIHFHGTAITHIPTHQRAALGLGYVPQVDNAFLDLSVADNLRMGGYLCLDGEVGGRMDEVFALFPRLAERRRMRAGALSGGERRMLAIGTCLMMQPTMLLLDEPSSDLAPAAADVVFECIGRIHLAHRLPILLVEQNVRRALMTAARAYVLVAGRRVLTSLTATLTEDRLSAIFLEGVDSRP